MRNLEPTLAVFRRDGPVCPFLCVFGVLEVFFFAAHHSDPDIDLQLANTDGVSSFREIRARPKLFCRAKKRPCQNGRATWELKSSGGWIAPSNASMFAAAVGSGKTVDP